MKICSDCGAICDVDNSYEVVWDNCEHKIVCYSCSQKYGLNCFHSDDNNNKDEKEN